MKKRRRHTQLVEQVKQGHSRIADDVRRCLAEFKHLRRITVSNNAPDWRRDAVLRVSAPKGLTTIKLYDKKLFAEVWYKTATNNGSRAKVFIRGVRSSPRSASKE